MSHPGPQFFFLNWASAFWSGQVVLKSHSPCLASAFKNLIFTLRFSKSLWPGRKSLRQKNLKKIAKTFTSGNRPTSTTFSINYQTKNQKLSLLNNRFRKAGLCARKWPDCIFLHLLIQSFWVPCDLLSKHFSKKKPIWSWD